MDGQYSNAYHSKPSRQGFGLTTLVIVALVSAFVGGLAAAYLGPNFIYGRYLPWPSQSGQESDYQLPPIGGEDPADEIAAGVVEQVAARVSPAVVGITNRYVMQGSFRAYENQAVGSGVIIDPNGYIVTNNHVVENTHELTVTLTAGVETPATLVGRDAVTDLAVIKIDPSSLPETSQKLSVAEFGDSDAIKVGQLAIAIGNPLGLQFQRSVTFGIISALNRDLQMEGVQLKLIQTDAAINSGNSGGALVDKNGRIIGINQAKIKLDGVEGMGFAIPSNTVRPIVEQLIQSGKVTRPFLGVGINVEISQQHNRIYNLGTDHGLLISRVSANSPAAKAGIKVEDILVQMDGEDIHTFNQMQSILFSKEIGEQIEVVVVRRGVRKTLQVKLAATP